MGLRAQGEPDQSTDDEERKLSLLKSLMKSFLESPNKDKSKAELFPKDDDKKDAKNTVKEQGKSLSS